MKLLIPLALSLLVSSYPNHQNLPREFSTASAEAARIAHTLARELHFALESPDLAPEELESLDNFLKAHQIKELKVILWLPPEASPDLLELVQARIAYMARALRAHGIPFEIFTLESPFYEDAQGSVLAVLAE